MELIPRNCPLCGSNDESRVFAEASYDLDRLDQFGFASRKVPEYMHYRLVECPQCDLLYGNPIPRQEELVEAYVEAGFDSNEEAQYAGQTYGAYLPRILRRLPDRDGALDIGTGEGAFLEALLAHGFQNVVGVEPSKEPIRQAKPEIRPLIQERIFSPDGFRPGQFSLITCFQTLEHLYDPMRMCRQAFDLLKPGGAVYFIGHDRRALSARLLGKKSPIFDIEHLQLFSPKSAANLLKTCGFEAVDIGPIVNRYPIRYYCKLFPMPGSLKTRILARLSHSRFGKTAVAMPLGNLMMIGYKPR